MKMTRCERGEHMYDADVNSSCPFCRQVELAMGPGGIPETMGIPETVEKQSTVSQGGATVGFGTRQMQQGAATVALLDPAKKEFSPVVGWLVVVSETNRGRDFRIWDGWNAVGREAVCEVYIDFDNGVSRGKHAFVVYDHEANAFYAKHGEGTNGTRLNGKMIGDLTPLAPYDVLRIGATELMFVPFCSEKFRWTPGPSSDTM